VKSANDNAICGTFGAVSFDTAIGGKSSVKIAY
jgi:hypothetical protein